jgi:hypothetical protein
MGIGFRGWVYVQDWFPRGERVNYPVIEYLKLPVN